MSDDADAWIEPATAQRLDGDERFRGLDSTVRQFWRFALSDLRMNNARGYLAEFLVARALDIVDPQRIEWAEYDVLWDGIRIEVKSSAYLQAWEQRQLSRITFSGLTGTPYNPRTGYDPSGKRYNAHVYVFGVQTAQTHQAYDPLNVDQWEWYVVPAEVLVGLGQASISLATLRTKTDHIGFADIAGAVRAAARRAISKPAGTDEPARAASDTAS